MTETPDAPQPDDHDALAEAASIIDEAAQNIAAGGESDVADTAPADEAGAGDALTEAEAKAAEHLADLQRLQAEYVNYRKRVERDRALAGELATAKTVEALIPVLDDILAARKHGDLTEGPFAAIAEKLETTLGRLGWESYGAPGEPFDPAIHEALLTQESADVTEAQIAEVVQPGHRIGERILRPARVVVAQPAE